MLELLTIRTEVLPVIFVRRTPGSSVLAKKILACPSATSLATTATYSDSAALPIQRLAPLRIHVPLSKRAVVSNPRATSDPWAGSVSAKQPVIEIGRAHV